MSSHASKKVDQKEYLRKYLSGDKDRKKKKDKKQKNSSSTTANVRIIDDDISAAEIQRQLQREIDEELLLTGDDAPIIVGEYVEERSMSSNGANSKWRSIGVKEEVDEPARKPKLEDADRWGRKADDELKRKNPFSPANTKSKLAPAPNLSPPRRKRPTTPDLSPPRSKRPTTPDLSPPRSKRVTTPDLSPPRRKRPITPDHSPPRRPKDFTPPKRPKVEKDLSPPRRRRMSRDLSSPRRRRLENDDLSPPRRRRQDDNKSPPHARRFDNRNRNMNTPPRRFNDERRDDNRMRSRGGGGGGGQSRNNFCSPQRGAQWSKPQFQRERDGRQQYNVREYQMRNKFRDSPPRRPRERSFGGHSPPKMRQRVESPQRRTQRARERSSSSSHRRRLSQKPDSQRSRGNSAHSPLRGRIRSPSSPRPLPAQRKRNLPNRSPPRIKQERRTPFASHSPPPLSQIKRERRTPPGRSSVKRASTPPNLSTARRNRWSKAHSPHSPSPPPTHKPKVRQTLDGKRAGLQDAQALQTETEERRRREERMYEQMPSELSGRDAEVQMRSTRRRGQRARDAAAEDPEEMRRKEAHEQKKRELYDRWGKGVKQVEEHRARLEEQAYEAAKPLARYADDEDLERHLREKERLEDPMLDYMRQKKKQRQREAKEPTMPIYEGSYPENRFGIRPGYRWDGVDRSNGYEKKWFDKQNERRAVQEEAYKYSVEDM